MSKADLVRMMQRSTVETGSLDLVSTVLTYRHTLASAWADGVDRVLARRLAKIELCKRGIRID